MEVKRIAVWSGPRNLSTALMRSFASRNDCTAIDEPFYAAYLKHSSVEHPMKDEIIALCNSDPLEVAYNCTNGFSLTKIQYQKHMTHHMLNEFDRSFVYDLSNVFLIRSPIKVIKSFGKKLKEFTLEELGFVQQFDLFNMLIDRTGLAPPVIDADELCANPVGGLSILCSKLNIDYCESMLSWKEGSHSYDGLWGKYWYESVKNSSGFKVQYKNITEPTSFEKDLIDHVTPIFEKLNKYKLKF